jgi:hypothetical protein
VGGAEGAWVTTGVWILRGGGTAQPSTLSFVNFSFRFDSIFPGYCIRCVPNFPQIYTDNMFSLDIIAKNFSQTFSLHSTGPPSIFVRVRTVVAVSVQ